MLGSVAEPGFWLREAGQDFFFLMNNKIKTKQELINKIKNITNEINK
jgi:hypothetical protein